MNRTRKRSRPVYRDGERKCPICDAPLPAHQTWPGADYRFCGAPKCAAKVKKLQQARYVGPNELKCHRAVCDNFVPEGRYRVNPAVICCSAECWYSHTFKDGGEKIKCDCGCGTKLPGRRNRITLTASSFYHQSIWATTTGRRIWRSRVASSAKSPTSTWGIRSVALQRDGWR